MLDFPFLAAILSHRLQELIACLPLQVRGWQMQVLGSCHLGGTLALVLTCCGTLGSFPSLSKPHLPFQSGIVKDQFHRVTVRLKRYDIREVLSAWHIVIKAQ